MPASAPVLVCGHARAHACASMPVPERTIRAAFAGLLLVALAAPTAAAQDAPRAASAREARLELAPLFRDHMVLQRDLPVTVWGEAQPGQHVTVAVADRTARAEAGADGRFRARLAPLPAGGPHTLTARASGAGGEDGSEDGAGDGVERAVRDVLIGEVWLASGQSNMAWPMHRFEDCQDDIAAADLPELRLYTVPRTTAAAPRASVGGRWSPCTPDVAKDFSAVAFFFGRELRRALDVPIGIVHSSWGGTRAEAWTRRAALARDPATDAILSRWQPLIDGWPAASQRHREALADWKERTAAAEAAGDKAPPKPRAPRGPLDRHCPAALYNGMIAPLVPFTIRGVIWYQGEANAPRAHQYRTLFPTMIRDWRRAFGQGHFPFLFVQLANFVRRNRPREEWAELREAQRLALMEPNTGMAVTIDIGDKDDIHPDQKEEVGRRLSLWARARTYGQDLVCSGPLYRHMRIEGPRVRVHFEHTGGGLEARGGERLQGFRIAGDDREFHPADAAIDGETVVVSCDSVQHPVAVRYGWDADPQCNLYNEEGLPASPFRTDDWPGVTFERR